jgi:hypothetical protein
VVLMTVSEWAISFGGLLPIKKLCTIERRASNFSETGNQSVKHNVKEFQQFNAYRF